MAETKKSNFRTTGTISEEEFKLWLGMAKYMAEKKNNFRTTGPISEEKFEFWWQNPGGTCTVFDKIAMTGRSPKSCFVVASEMHPLQGRYMKPSSCLIDATEFIFSAYKNLISRNK